MSARVLAKMAYRDEPEGVLAVFETPQRTLPADATLLVVAVGIEKPGNLGAIARTADAAGADGMLVADGEVDPWNPNAIRASTGSVFTLPIVEATRDDVAALPQQKDRCGARRRRRVTPTPTYAADRVPDRRRGHRPRRHVARDRRPAGRDPDERERRRTR